VPALRPPIIRPALLWLATAAAYFGVSWASSRCGLVHQGVPLLIPAAGIAFSALQLGPPWLATALAVAGFGEGLRQGMPPAAAALLGAAAAGTGLAARALTHAARLRPAGEQIFDTLVRTAAACAAALVGATLLLASLVAADRAPDAAELWGVLLVAHVAGILAVSPFVRAWIQRGSRGVAGTRERVALLLVASAIAAVGAVGVSGTAAPSLYLVFPVVVWAALRTGRMGVSAAVLGAALLAVHNAAAGRGVFDEPSVMQMAVRLDLFLVVLALTGLLLAGLELERRVAATGLTEAQERHRTLLEQLPLVTYVRSLEDPDVPPLYTSPQIEGLLGYPRERWQSEPRFASKLVHPEDREINAEVNARSLVEDVVRGEYRMIHANGSVVWVLDHMAVVRDSAGKAVTQQGFVVDISARKALEEQVGRGQRIEALGLLAGGIAHDFNNLLTAISGYTSLALEHGGQDNERVRNDLEEVSTAAGRAAQLTRQLLAFGRRQVLGRTVVDLNAVVIEVRPRLDRMIGEHVTVVTRLEPDLVRVHADVGQLEQVLVNLAANASDAMPDGGTLTISTSNDGGDAVLTVSDTGHGMDTETCSRIFEPFFSTKPVGEGTGLGLAMVHGIVKQTAGEISVESTNGRGSAFRIVLPGTHEVATEAVAAVEDSRRGSETVLLVDDEDIVRRLTASMLESQGYHVVVAAGPDEALEVTEQFDLLLTDVVMPSMSGPELAERLVEHWPGVGVLFTSGYSAGAVLDRGALIADLLEKPFTIEELARKVREALDARPVTLT
jgi:PAS domain S-box-containing protein